MLCMSARWTSKLLITEILIGNWLTSISMARVLIFPVCRLFFNAANKFILDSSARDADIPGYETNILRISRISSRPGIIRDISPSSFRATGIDVR